MVMLGQLFGEAGMMAISAQKKVNVAIASWEWFLF